MWFDSSATTQSFPERLKLPFSCEDILSGYEQLASSGSDHFTMWWKMSPHEILAEHVVGIQKVEADFRDALERNQSSSSQTCGVNKYFSSQSPVQTRLSIHNWNPGPRRGKEDAFEKQIAVKWHVVTLQEPSDYVEHDILHEWFHVTHYAGCAILFNEDTFYPDISVKSIYLLDTRRGLQDQVVEGEQGSVLQGVLSRAFSSSRSQWSKILHCFVPACQQHLRQEERHRQEDHPDSSCQYDFSRSWPGCRWFQWNSLAMSQPVTISVLLMKLLLIVPCLRHRAPHHCGDRDPSE